MKNKYKLYCLALVVILLNACSRSEEIPSENKPDITPPSTIALPSEGTYSEQQMISLSCNDNKSGCDISKIYFSTNPQSDAQNFDLFDANKKIVIPGFV